MTLSTHNIYTKQHILTYYLEMLNIKNYWKNTIPYQPQKENTGLKLTAVLTNWEISKTNTVITTNTLTMFPIQKSS